MLAALTFSGSRRAKWLVVGFWVVVLFAMGGSNVFEKYTDAERNRTVDYAPGDADSVKALEKVEGFPSGERFAAVVVYRRDGPRRSSRRTAPPRWSRCRSRPRARAT